MTQDYEEALARHQAFAGAADLTPNVEAAKAPKAVVAQLAFRNLYTEDPDMIVDVHDKYPEMEDVHIEGRRYIEVSVEWFVEAASQQGWFAVNPATGKTAIEERMTTND